MGRNRNHWPLLEPPRPGSIGIHDADRARPAPPRPRLNASNSGTANPRRPIADAATRSKTASQHGISPPPSPISTIRSQPPVVFSLFRRRAVMVMVFVPVIVRVPAVMIVVVDGVR